MDYLRKSFVEEKIREFTADLENKIGEFISDVKADELVFYNFEIKIELFERDNQYKNTIYSFLIY